MFKIFDEKINGILFVIIFPFLLFLMSYYGFESSYVRMKDMEKAPDFMFSSVYAYRVIPNFLSVYVTYGVTYIVDHILPFTKGFLLKNGTLFYHSTFLINVFFFIGTSIILNTIFKLKTAQFLLNINVRRVVHLLAVFFMVIVQYVPTNCDSIALFFYVWGILLTLKYFHNRSSKYLIGLSVIIFISTFVRETACLNIAFFGALFIDFKELTKGKLIYWKEVGFLVISFIVPYIVLRLIIRQDTSFFEGVYLVKNFTSPYNLAGLLFGVIGLYLTYKLCDENGRMILKKYLFFSSPYLLMITLVGLFWEARLFMPLILAGFVVASHQFKNIIPSNS
ncbi:hypothetical protein [Chryseobacterium sp.]|uniref:hypothetical protein n=1 Tax=Chryseobacterium sp. TaxID=1871047 RepID=UPI0025B850A3|nr:hypothetical protein [Chryseobacterium sp.]